MKTKQIIITSLAIVLTIALFNWIDIDLWLQDFFYNTELKQWLLGHDQKLVKLILYDGIKRVYIIAVLALGLMVWLYRKRPMVKNYQPGLNIVLLSCLAVPLIVGGLKTFTNVPCPRDITHYNGSQPYVTILKSYPDNFIQTSRQLCFPAAHASGGFALMSLFFLFKRKRNKVIALATTFSLGWATGLYKMLIGDHFLSHTIVSMLLAWLIILLIAKTFQTRSQPS